MGDKWTEVYFGADELDQSQALEHQALDQANELVEKAKKIIEDKGGINRMTEKMTLEEFGNLVKFCEQKYVLTPEEVKIVVMEFSEQQLKDLSEVSEKARMYLKERFDCTPFDYIRVNGNDADIERLNKFAEKL